MIVMARRDRYQMYVAPAINPATIAAAMIAPVNPKAASDTSIMLNSSAGFSGTTRTIVGVMGCTSPVAGCCCTIRLSGKTAARNFD